MADLPIISVKASAAYPDVVGAPTVLSDTSDTTGIRLSSAANGETRTGSDAGYGAYGYAEYLIHFGGPLPASARSVTLNVRLRVLSRDMADAGFEIRATLRDPAWAAADIRVDRVCVDGDITDITVVIDDAWLAASAGSFGNEYASITSGDYTYAGLAAALGSTPVIHLIDRDGSPFEVDILRVALTAGAATYRRTFPRDDSLAGSPGRNYPPSRAIQSSSRIGGGYL